MLSPLSYVGSKRLDIKFFKQYLPPNIKKTVEPFCGGGAVSLYLYNINNNIDCFLNDTDTCLINYFLDMKTKAQNIVDKVNNFTDTMTKETFMAEIKKFKTSNYSDEDRSYYYYFYNKIHGIRIGMYPCRTAGKINLEKFQPYLSWVKKAVFSNDDFNVTLNKFKDDEDAFVFLDPPYMDAHNSNYSLYNKPKIDIVDDGIKKKRMIVDNTKIFIDILKFIETAKCKVMLIINKNGITSYIYRDGII